MAAVLASPANPFPPSVRVNAERRRLVPGRAHLADQATTNLHLI
jgi:hypothetical protein